MARPNVGPPTASTIKWKSPSTRLDDVGGAERAEECLHLAGVAHQRRDVGTALPGELDRHPPDATRRAGDQHALAEYETCDLERPQRRHAGSRQRGGLCVGDRVGDRCHAVGRDRDELRPGTRMGQADHARALRMSTTVGCGSRDHTRRIPARH